MPVRGLFAIGVIAACGGRTGLRDTPTDGGVVIVDASSDHAATDAHVTIDGGGTCSFDDDPSPAAVQSYGACGEGVNIAAPPVNNCGGIGAAFEYVPEFDVVIERIELHTDAATIGLLDSDPACDRPGKVLFLGQTDAQVVSGWRGAFVNPPIGVKANHKYFVWQAPAQGQTSTSCSVAETGVDVREYTAPDPNGPWDGPFGGLAWSARLDGVCP